MASENWINPNCNISTGILTIYFKELEDYCNKIEKILNGRRKKTLIKTALLASILGAFVTQKGIKSCTYNDVLNFNIDRTYYGDQDNIFDEKRYDYIHFEKESRGNQTISNLLSKQASFIHADNFEVMYNLEKETQEDVSYQAEVLKQEDSFMSKLLGFKPIEKIYTYSGKIEDESVIDAYFNCTDCDDNYLEDEYQKVVFNVNGSIKNIEGRLLNVGELAILLTEVLGLFTIGGYILKRKLKNVSCSKYIEKDISELKEYVNELENIIDWFDEYLDYRTLVPSLFEDYEQKRSYLSYLIIDANNYINKYSSDKVYSL